MAPTPQPSAPPLVAAPHWLTCSSCNRSFELVKPWDTPDHSLPIQPRILDCSHTVCSPCLRRGYALTRRVVCPVQECKRSSRPPPPNTDITKIYPLNRFVMGELVMGLTGEDCASPYPPSVVTRPPESHPLSQTIGDLGRVRQSLEVESRRTEDEMRNAISLQIARILHAHFLAMRRQRGLVRGELKRLDVLEIAIQAEMKKSKCGMLRLQPAWPQPLIKLEERPIGVGISRQTSFMGYKLVSLKRGKSELDRSFDMLDVIREDVQEEEEDVIDDNNNNVMTEPPPTVDNETRDLEIGSSLGPSDFVFSEIHSPHRFYVRLKSAKEDSFLALQRAIIPENGHGSLGVPPDRANLIGLRCLAKRFHCYERFSVTNCRDGSVVDGLFVDSGSRGTVAVADLLELPESGDDPQSPVHWPSLAFRCRLGDAAPVSGGREWTKEARQTFADIMRMNRLRINLTVVDIDEKGCHRVKLLIQKPPDTGEPPTDIGEVLAFHRAARTPPNPWKSEDDYPFAKRDLTQGTTHVGSVKDVNGDGVAMFVKHGEGKRKLDTCLEQMAVLFGSSANFDYSIDCPRANQAVAYIEKMGDGQILYSRAVVMAVHVDSMSVTVKLVDTGNVVEVKNLNDLRLLPRAFTVQPALSSETILFGVKIKEEYLGEVRDYLRGKEVHGFVESTNLGFSVVTFYVRHPSKDICVNALLLEMGWAVSSSPEPPPRRTTYFKLSSAELIKRGDETFLRHFAASLPPDAHDLLVPYHVVNVISPSDFRLVEEKDYINHQKLHLALQLEYAKRGSAKETILYNVGDLVAVYHNNFAWLRARVDEVRERNSYIVWLTDHSRDVLALESQMRPLKESFQKQAPRGSRYSLPGLKPSGECASKWHHESFVVFKRLLEWKNATIMAQVIDRAGGGHDETTKKLASLYLRVEVCRDSMQPNIMLFCDVRKMLLEADVARDVDSECLPRSYLSMTRWKPPLPPKLLEEDIDGTSEGTLSGTIVYVDKTGDVFVELKEYQETILSIRETLQKCYTGSLMRPHDESFVIGEACVVNYNWDDLWYRAEVEANVAPGFYDVRLVDYGTVAFRVAVERLRKEVLLIDQPALNTRIKWNIVPRKGVSMLDLHSAVVGQTVKVIIRGPIIVGSSLQGEVLGLSKILEGMIIH